MTTSEPQKGAPLKQGSDLATTLPATSFDVPAGWPDTETIARMANEFFTALPVSENAMPTIPGATSGSMPSALPGMAGAPDLPSRFAPPSPHDLPSETRIHSALAALPQNVQPQIPAIPGALMSPPGNSRKPRRCPLLRSDKRLCIPRRSPAPFRFRRPDLRPRSSSRRHQNPNRNRPPLARRRILHHPSAARQRTATLTKRPANPRRPNRRKSRRPLPRLQLPQRNSPTRLDSVIRITDSLDIGASPQ